ncbi:hypothetical protein [Wolbachia endosymbiont of Chironomus riparius]|uniref:hypothetical protein n=1 Tax=Wolbachia endosymbiont of Chironomus riparius TaxID=2883238 RepID=UPI0020A053CF|nr:hypothetical protein [Wolbachia endosymbiont of Chironomus riparius]
MVDIFSIDSLGDLMDFTLESKNNFNIDTEKIARSVNKDLQDTALNMLPVNSILCKGTAMVDTSLIDNLGDLVDFALASHKLIENNLSTDMEKTVHSVSKGSQDTALNNNHNSINLENFAQQNIEDLQNTPLKIDELAKNNIDIEKPAQQEHEELLYISRKLGVPTNSNIDLGTEKISQQNFDTSPLEKDVTFSDRIGPIL